MYSQRLSKATRRRQNTVNLVDRPVVRGRPTDGEMGEARRDFGLRAVRRSRELFTRGVRRGYTIS